MTTTFVGYYLTHKQIAEQQGCCTRHVRDLQHEIMDLIGYRYESYAVLEDSNMINMYVLYDYLKYRKALKDPIVRQRVPEFEPESIAKLCPVVERWMVYP